MRLRPMRPASSRPARVGKKFLHHEILEPSVVPCTSGQYQSPAQAMRFAEDILLLMIANDRDHAAHHRDADVVVVAFANLDQLLGVAADVPVPAKEEKLGIVIAH